VDDPYVDQTPFNMLSREFLVHSQSLSEGNSIFIFPSHLLLAMPTISRLLQNYQFLKSDMRIRIEISSSPMQYGSVTVSILPYLDVSDPRLQDFVAQSQSDMTLLDITANSAVVYELPYIRKESFYELNSTISELFDWRVAISAPIISTLTLDTATTVTVNVFASFVNPHAAGYIIPEDSSAIFQSSSRMRQGMAIAGKTAAASAFTVSSLAFAAFTSASQQDEGPTEPTQPVQLGLIGDVSSPKHVPDTSATPLGDCVPYRPDFIPSHRNHYMLSDILQIPTYLQKTVLSTSDTTIEVIPSTMDRSYVQYFSRMFKYWRGSQKFLLRFIGSPFFTARVAVALLPVGGFGTVSSAFGDVKTWEITVCGTEELLVTVPYLHMHPWQSTVYSELTEHVPLIKFKLLQNIVQPYDKTVTLTCQVFYSVGEDFRFAGLQSPADPTPIPPLVATFQSVLARSFLGENIDCIDRNYQGQNFDTCSMLQRFSSIIPPSDVTPYPYAIWEPEYFAWDEDQDLYNWILSLYAFNAGPIRTKFLFTTSSESGVLAIGISNNRSAGALTDKSGDSIAVTHQSVWPAIHTTMPYMNKYPFRSILNPAVPEWGLTTDIGTSVSRVYVAPARGFVMAYLLPVPEFPAEAVFQSYTGSVDRITLQDVYAASLIKAVASGTTATATILASFDYTTTFCIEVDAILVRTAGTTSAPDGMISLTSNNATVPQAATTTPSIRSGFLASAPIPWVDTANNGREAARATIKMCASNISTAAPLYLQLFQTDLLSAWSLTYSLKITPWSGIFMPSSPQFVADTIGLVRQMAPLDVNISASSVTLDVDVQNTVPISISGSVTVDTGDVPLWTTLYKP